MSRRFSGLLIGAGFGVIFVMVNAKAPLNPALGLTLRVLAVLALAALIAVAATLSRGPARPPTTRPPTTRPSSTQPSSAPISSTRIPSAQIPSAQIPSARIPSAQIPSAQIPLAQIPTAQEPAATGELRTDVFGPGYWAVVAAEVLGVFVGYQVLRLIDAPAEASVAWVATVVGLHFIAFLWVWHQPTVLVPGVLLTGYGVAGLVMSATSAAAWVPFVSGVLSGLTLLACCLLVAVRELVVARTLPA
jgi:hypothetical protein